MQELVPVVQCEARKRFEQRLELVLSGATPSMVPSARLRSLTPVASRPSLTDHPDVSFIYTGAISYTITIIGFLTNIFKSRFFFQRFLFQKYRFWSTLLKLIYNEFWILKVVLIGASGAYVASPGCIVSALHSVFI